MTPARSSAKRQILSTALRSLVHDMGDRWLEDDIAWVNEYIDNFEFALALETLAAIAARTP